jgi:hypothetical protein
VVEEYPLTRFGAGVDLVVREVRRQPVVDPRFTNAPEALGVGTDRCVLAEVLVEPLDPELPVGSLLTEFCLATNPVDPANDPFPPAVLQVGTAFDR